MKIPADLRPGDCLLYRAKGVFGWIISIKTWSEIGHVEVFVGKGESVASRDGIGVGRFPLRLAQLAYVLRPRSDVGQTFSLPDALTWFELVKGQKYDWFGLLRFAWRSQFVPGDPDNKQFCSEFATRFYRKGGLDPFNGADADARPPSEFLLSNVYTVVRV